MAPWSRVLIALALGPGLVPNTSMAAHNLSFRGSDGLFPTSATCTHIHTWYRYTYVYVCIMYIYVYIHTGKISIYIIQRKILNSTRSFILEEERIRGH